jgi:PTH1 family peptidyl-tRNA hydrolase
MFIIAGLGNPEETYKGTRHNIGFETINKLAYDYRITVKKYRHRAFIGQGVIAQTPVVLAKPQTYMNASGESVRALLQFYKVTPNTGLIIVYDDINLALGDIRVRAQGSAGGHNGMKSLIEQLGTDIFTRVRVGINEKPEGWDLADYVLSRFKKDEFDKMVEGVTKAGDAVAHILQHGVDAAMNKYNRTNDSGTHKPRPEKSETGSGKNIQKAEAKQKPDAPEGISPTAVWE